MNCAPPAPNPASSELSPNSKSAIGNISMRRANSSASRLLSSAIIDADVMLTTYREQPAQIWRGVTLTELLQFWGGDEAGSNFSGPREDFPVAVLIGSQATHAVGVATAFKLRHQRRVSVCALGDGATSKGDFYESINLAGVWQLPAVFIVINNYWAISMPREKQTAAETLAQKAIAA